MDLISLVQQHRDSFADAKDKILNNHASWDKVKDARVTAFSKCINVLNSTQLGMVHIQFNLINKQWWNSISKENIQNADVQIYINEFDMFIKLGFLQFLFSSTESSFRLFVKAIDPTACSNGTDTFKNIYSYLFARLNLQKYEPLLDLLRCIRNTIHNNGVYFNRYGKNETVVYKDTTYTFENGKPIECATWQFLLNLVPEIEQMIVDVVESNEVSSIVSIVDPYAP